MIPDNDDSERLIDAVKKAYHARKALAISGHASKSSFVRSIAGDALQTADHRGIIEYRPDELMISVRSGTPIQEVIDALASEDQVLACDPPQFQSAGTIGGAVATGLCGPGRPWYGSVRDAVLGVDMVNGLAESLSFGGRVMKNVAGFDVSRFMAGSLGTMGLLLTVNLRVNPKPEYERSIQINLSDEDAHAIVLQSLRKPSLITATCYRSGQLALRFSGRHDSVELAVGDYPDMVDLESDYWSVIRDHDHAFFRDAEDLHRIWLPRGVQFDSTESGDYLTEWAGSQVWVQRAPKQQHSSGDANAIERFQRKSNANTPQSKYHRRLRNAFDPRGVLNPDISF